MLKASLILAASIAFASFVASSDAALAKPKKPSGVFRQSTCQSVHEACVGRCINSGKAGSQLNRCSEGCAGKYLRCKQRQTRQ